MRLAIVCGQWQNFYDNGIGTVRAEKTSCRFANGSFMRIRGRSERAPLLLARDQRIDGGSIDCLSCRLCVFEVSILISTLAVER